MNKLSERNDELLKQNKAFEKENKKELEKYEKEIQSINSRYYSLVNQNNNEILNNKKTIQKFSTFNLDSIGKIIAKLISTIELEEYKYINCTHDTYYFESGPYGKDSFKTINDCNLVVLKKNKSNYYRDRDDSHDEISSLCFKKKAYLLYEGREKVNKTVLPIETINPNRIDYVDEFLNELIDYKIDNEIENISKEQLEILLNKFLYKKSKLILENKERKILEEQKELERKEKEKKELEELLKPRIIPDSKISERIKDILVNNDTFKKMINNVKIIVANHICSDKNIIPITNITPIIDTNMIYIGKCEINGKACIDEPYDEYSHYYISAEILIGICDVSNDKNNSYKSDYLSEGKFSNDRGSYYEQYIGDYFVILYSPDNFYYNIDFDTSYEKRRDRKYDNIKKVIQDEDVDTIFKYLVEIEKECNVPKILSKKYNE